MSARCLGSRPWSKALSFHMLLQPSSDHPKFKGWSLKKTRLLTFPASHVGENDFLMEGHVVDGMCVEAHRVPNVCGGATERSIQVVDVVRRN